jgi:uncharacterized protein (TIGR02300 family)
VAKAELGTKRRCLNCAGSFFDLDRTPIVCPKCGAAFQIVEYARSRPRWTPSSPITTKKSDASELVESSLVDAEDENATPPIDDDEDADREDDDEAEEAEQDGAAED